MTLRRVTVHHWSLLSSLRCATIITVSANYVWLRLTAAAYGGNDGNEHDFTHTQSSPKADQNVLQFSQLSCKLHMLSM